MTPALGPSEKQGFVSLLNRESREGQVLFQTFTKSLVKRQTLSILLQDLRTFPPGANLLHQVPNYATLA